MRKLLKNIFIILRYSITFLGSYSGFAQNPPFEIDTLRLEPPYMVLVTTYNDPGVYPPEISIEILNTQSNEVIYYEDSEEFMNGFVFGKSYFKIGGSSAAFLEFQGGTLQESTPNSLLILVPKKDSVYRSVIKTKGYFQIMNLDSDEESELVVSEHLYNRLNVRGCKNVTHPSQFFEGSLVPQIYEWQGDSLMLVKERKELLGYYSEYIRAQEELFSNDKEHFINHYKDYSRPNIPTLLDYAQYYYLCYVVKKKRRYAVEFFKKNDKLFMYVCRDVPGRSFTIDTSLSRFFENFGREIILDQEK